jgi:hypothetical protein
MKKRLLLVIFVAVLSFGMSVRAHAQLATTITVKNTTSYTMTLNLEGQTLANAFVGPPHPSRRVSVPGRVSRSSLLAHTPILPLRVSTSWTPTILRDAP